MKSPWWATRDRCKHNGDEDLLMSILTYPDSQTIPTAGCRGWFCDPATNTLVHGLSNYDVPLRNIHSKGSVDEWCRHISEKRFMSIADLCDPRNALEALVFEARS